MKNSSDIYQGRRNFKFQHHEINVHKKKIDFQKQISNGTRKTLILTSIIFTFVRERFQEKPKLTFYNSCKTQRKQKIKIKKNSRLLSESSIHRRENTHRKNYSYGCGGRRLNLEICNAFESQNFVFNFFWSNSREY